MKYLSLPVHLLKFWYPEALVVLIRTWRNIILYLEEDLAVGLMFRLLFVPLFHDSSIVGRGLSFLFRSCRILIGLFAFLAATLLVITLAGYWFLLPGLIFYATGVYGLILKGFFFAGIVLFVNHIFSHPHKKVWQIKSAEEVWQCSYVGKNDLGFDKLLKTERVFNLLAYLELSPVGLSGFAGDVSQSEVLQKVWEIGKKFRVPYLYHEHFFVALLSLTPGVESGLLKLGVSSEDFYDALDFLQRRADMWRVVWVFDEDFRTRHLKGVNRGWLGVPTPNLDLVGEDLTKRASKERVPDFIGRQEVVSRIINILSLEAGRNVLLVGEPGSGRGALVGYLAKLIISGDAPAALSTKRLVRLNETKLLSGITAQGELAERIKNIFEDVKNSGNIIVYMDEIQNFGVGEVDSKYNLYSLMESFLESSDFQFVAVTDAASYTKILEKDKSFARIFTRVVLPPATVSETADILKTHAILGERYKKIRTSVPAILEIAKLSAEYIKTQVLPDAALKVFEECLVSADQGWVRKSVVEKVVQARTSVPVGEAGAEIKHDLLNLEETIHGRMVNQVEAVTAVAGVLRRAAAELRDKNRPIGSFLFVGPTGVGKTELAKTLVDVYFQGKGNFARFDMSEYQSSESVNRLIGGSGEEGILTETVRQHPYSLILLDEFEKADPKILTLFLQVLDDGRLTSGSGKTVDFTNTIVIATSNAASLTIAHGLEAGKRMDQLKKEVGDELLAIFKPELINRFDEVVLFKPLTSQDLRKIVGLKLAELQNHLKEQGYLVEFDGGVAQKLAERGFDPVLGARPLRRLIQDTLEARLSVMILEGKLHKGGKVIFDFDFKER